VAKYMGRSRSGSLSWLTFLRIHLPETAACEFFTLPTATFRVLYCFLVLSHDRRRIVHVNVTTNPSAEWTAQHKWSRRSPATARSRSFLFETAMESTGTFFRRRVQNIGIREMITSRKSPWQNSYVERVIGSIRRECLDHVIVLGEAHLRRILRAYVRYYNLSRPHLSLERNAPVPRMIEPPSRGGVTAIPLVGGLHHRYKRAA